MSETAPTLKISEVFDSIQGEGPSIGSPARFLRLALCNLRCTWCDSRYTWDFKTFEYAKEVTDLSVASVAQSLTRTPLTTLVITGGEPLLQTPSLEVLCDLLPPALPIEIETNGTIAPSQKLLRRVTQWNVSVKLANCGEPARRRLNFPALKAFRQHSGAWLKLVLEPGEPADEVKALLLETNWPRHRALFMPQCTNREQHRARLSCLVDVSKQAGVRLTPRLHLELWDGARAR